MAARIHPAKGKKGDKRWTSAIALAVMREAQDGNEKYLARIAQKLVGLAMKGDLAAMKEIGDRLDGKPPQTIAGDSDKPHELVIRVIDPTRGITLENDE